MHVIAKMVVFPFSPLLFNSIKNPMERAIKANRKVVAKSKTGKVGSDDKKEKVITLFGFG